MSESPEQPKPLLDQPVSRRGFLQYVLLGVSGAAVAGGVIAPIIAYLWPPKQASAASGGPIAVGSTTDLPVGTGQVYSVANKPVLVVHTAEGFKAVSATCTHLGCIVYWDEERQVVACPCHAAYFTVNGDVISGPPPAPLPTYEVQVVGDQIYVQGG